MASGGIRQDFKETEGLTPFEDRTLRWVVKDEDDVNVSSMSGWTVTLYWLPSGARRTADGPTALAAAAIITRAATLSAPNADIAIAKADWTTYPLLVRGEFDYELWVAISAVQHRIAYGTIEVVS